MTFTLFKQIRKLKTTNSVRLTFIGKKILFNPRGNSDYRLLGNYRKQRLPEINWYWFEIFPNRRFVIIPVRMSTFTFALWRRNSSVKSVLLIPGFILCVFQCRVDFWNIVVTIAIQNSLAMNVSLTSSVSVNQQLNFIIIKGNYCCDLLCRWKT